MKRILPAAFLAMLVIVARPAFAFIHFTQNEFTTAESLDPGMTQMGVQFTLGEDYRSFYPVIRYGLGALAEVGVRFGATSADFKWPQDKLGPGNKLGALIGVDLKYQLIKETDGVPVDMAVKIGFDNTIINQKNASEIGFSAIFSKSFPLTERGYKLTPYAGLQMAAIYGSALPENDTSMYAFLGLEWKLTQKFMFLLEYKGGESNIGGVGIRFEY